MGKRKNIPESSPSESEIEWRDAILRRNADKANLLKTAQSIELMGKKLQNVLNKPAK